MTINQNYIAFEKRQCNDSQCALCTGPLVLAPYYPGFHLLEAPGPASTRLHLVGAARRMQPIRTDTNRTLSWSRPSTSRTTNVPQLQRLPCRNVFTFSARSIRDETGRVDCGRRTWGVVKADRGATLYFPLEEGA